MKTLALTAPSGERFTFICADIIRGIPIDPMLPIKFDDTPHDARNALSMAWWGVPFVSTDHDADPRHWPKGVRYDVRCLDGGAWDRSTAWGSFPTLEAAVDLALNGQPVWM